MLDRIVQIEQDTAEKFRQTAPASMLLKFQNHENGGSDILALRNMRAEDEPVEETSIDALLEHASCRDIRGIINTTQSTINAYEEWTRRSDNIMGLLQAVCPDRQSLGPALRAVSTFEPPAGEPSTDEQPSVVPENVVERLGLQGTFDLDQRRRLREAVIETAELNRLRRTIGQPELLDASGMDDAARRQERIRYLERLKNGLTVMREYLDTRINEQANELVRRMNGIARELREFPGDAEQFIETYGLTPDGVCDALAKRENSLNEIAGLRTQRQRPRTDDERFLTGAEEAVDKLERIAHELKNAPGATIPRLLVERAAHERDALEWAKRVAHVARKIDRAAITSPVLQRDFAQIEEILAGAPWDDATEQSRAQQYAVRQLEPHYRQWMEDVILMLYANPGRNVDEHNAEAAERKTGDSHQSVDAFRSVAWSTTLSKEEASRMEAAVQREEASEQGAIEHIRSGLRSRLNKIIPDILKAGDHPIAKYLDLEERLDTHRKVIEADILAGMTTTLRDAERRIERLEQCNTYLEKLFAQQSPPVIHVPTKAVFENETRDPKTGKTVDAFGFYSYGNGQVYLNNEKIQESHMQPAQVLKHEQGHAIIDAFRRFGVFPDILWDVALKADLRADQEKKDLWSTLREHAERWGIPVSEPLTREDKWHLMDEAINRCAEGTAPYPVYQFLEKQNRKGDELDESVRLNLDERRAFMTDTDDQAAAEAAAAAHAADQPKGDENARPDTSHFVDTRMEAMHRNMLHAKQFIVAYPSVTFTDVGSRDTRAFMVEKFDFATLEAKEKELEEIFKNGTYIEPDNPFLGNLSKMEAILKDLKEQFMDPVENAASDLTNVRKEGGGAWRQLNDNIAWVSIWDMGTMFKDMWEDIQRMWKRRGESARNKLGRAITELVPDNVLYLGRMKQEFERRERESEEAEVSVWEKGMEKIDAHELQHTILPRARTKDQVKAIINLLAKKGRLDWDDEHGLWAKLEQLSGYRMPHEACRKNNILRNQWLQKMMADIWRDKDRFEHWKTENDSSYDSGRKSFTNTVDNISTFKKEASECRKMLINYTRMIRGEKLAKEEEVNPHLYEELIHYCMRNGKMTMEDKFFYLIKGVECGLLTIDRLRTFPGEKGEVLARFPFIDFFTRHHNTYHEIDEIAGRITEDPLLGGDPYKPGPRMTRFLMEEVANDQEVLWRANKVLKNAQQIDHEDIPQLLTVVDYQAVTNIMSVYSGNQWKTSSQGVENAYVGFNNIGQYMGVKARIGHPPPTERDINKLVASLGAYALWDNIATQTAAKTATENRPFVSWQQIHNDIPVSGKVKTIHYRNAMSSFALELCRELGITQVDGGGPKGPIAIEHYIDPERGPTSAKKYKELYGDSWQRQFFDAPEDFVRQLQDRIKAQPNVLNRVLIKAVNNETFIPENNNLLLDSIEKSKAWNGDSGHGAPDHGGGH